MLPNKAEETLFPATSCARGMLAAGRCRPREALVSFTLVPCALALWVPLQFKGLQHGSLTSDIDL